MYNEKKVALTIYIISIMQMSALAVAPTLTAISQKFPDSPIMMVQMIISLPSLAMCISTLL